MWQIPQGNTKMRAMNNTWNHYQDNRPEWLLDDPARTHLQDYINAGVIAFLFGRGADGATCSCDANKDGVTNPAPINGNTRTSINADDDGGFFREKVVTYYAAGAMELGGGSTPPPTASPSPTPSPIASVSPTPTVPSQSTQTLTFNDISGQNQPLNGSYPTGVADWGSGQWYLSAPWGRFTTKNVSFASGRTSASTTFPAPRRLLRLDAYNGGTSSSTVTISCAGQPSVTTSVGARQLRTIATSWTRTCSSVRISSTNGWNTNFDNLVIDRGP
jgi:hypothetical protein